MHGAIDVHTHILPPRWDDWAARFGGAGWPRLVGDPIGAVQALPRRDASTGTSVPTPSIPSRRIADMDRRGIARQLLSPAPPLFCYWAHRPRLLPSGAAW